MSLEPAIPQHLRVERTQPSRAPEGFKGPTTNSHCTLFHPEVSGLVVLYLGVQREACVDASSAIATIEKWLGDNPLHQERATYNDPQGYTHTFVIAYWKNDASYHDFAATLPADWWHEGLPQDGQIGVSYECYRPRIIDTETTYSHQKPEGWGHLAERMTGPTDTHEYWGSARDRIPRSQTDPLTPDGTPAPVGFEPGMETLGRLVSVKPHDNLCVLRSGQSTVHAQGRDLTRFDKGITPVLKKGMGELEQQAGMKCYFNRFVTLEEGGGKKTFSYSAWHSLSDLEAWIEGPAHMAIFNARKAQFSNEGSDVELYHENMVLKADAQTFLYFNCHAATGMLRAFNAN